MGNRSLPVTARLRSKFFITIGGPQGHGHSVEEHVEKITGYFRFLPGAARLRSLFFITLGGPLTNEHSLRDVPILMERLGQTKAGFKSLTEAIDTTAPAGRMMMQMAGAFVEFERAMLRERTRAGLETARQEGRIGRRRQIILKVTARARG